MARGAFEVGKLIKAMGGEFNSAYGLAHLGDYETTLSFARTFLYTFHTKNKNLVFYIISGYFFHKTAQTLRGNRYYNNIAFIYGKL